MANGHFHTDITFVIMAGLSAVLIFNLIKLGSAHLVVNDNATLSTIGKSLGALVTT